MLRAMMIGLFLWSVFVLKATCEVVADQIQRTPEVVRYLAGLRKGCESGVAYDCYRFGCGHDGAEAEAACLKSCDLGVGAGCDVIGNIYSNSDSPEKQLKGVSFHRRGCDMGYADSCDNLGYAYSKGRGVSVDLPKATSFYRKACEMGETKACDSASLDTLRDRQKSAIDAVRKARKACERGEANDCWHLAQAYETGDGVPLDLRKAASFFGRACDLGQAGGCIIMGIMYEAGRGVAKDHAAAVLSYEKAAPLYLESCDAGDGRSCLLLGNMSYFPHFTYAISRQGPDRFL